MSAKSGLAPFACRGVLRYQGEHDAGEPQRYCSKLHALYDGWKGRFENPEMRFYFVQLCPWGKNIAPIQEEMARFERECLNSAMAVINDIGNNADIHPNEKALVGHRLALHALKRDYGFGEIRDNSPSVESWRVVSNTFEVVFKDCKSLYVYCRDWKFDLPFEIAGADGVFHPAEVLNLKTTKGHGGKPERKGRTGWHELLYQCYYVNKLCCHLPPVRRAQPRVTRGGIAFLENVKAIRCTIRLAFR